MVLSSSILGAALLLAPLSQAAHQASSIKGLNPSRYDLYIPSKTDTFTCLSGSKKTIPFSAINDDYCDCDDGSDEPGTSACRNATFYCANDGHIPGTILSSRVGDGICDPECCDGSDEPAGICPNVCSTVGQEYRSKRDEERKKRKTGSKIRSTYISFATKERTRLEEDVEKLQLQFHDKKKELERAERIVSEVERGQGEVMEKRKSSPLYTSLLTHRLTLSRLRSRTSRLESELQVLQGIMEDLVRSYNPNYQDMAVRAAAMGYMEVYHDGATPPAEGGGAGGKKDEEMAGGQQPVKEEAETEDEGEEKEEEVTDKELEELERLDLVGLLVGWDDGSEGSGEGGDDGESVLYNIAEYIPDTLTDTFEFLRGGIVYWLVKLGVVDKSTKIASSASSSSQTHVSSDETSAARQTLNSARTSLSDTDFSLKSTRQSLDDLSSKFGPQGEWKKLETVCLDKNLGEYTYELCFFGKATQKSNKGGGNNDLGHFSAWNYDGSAQEGTEAYYQKQLYDNGAKCWNGPNRSVKLLLSCAKENELLSIVEAEKCEYVFRATTPALCWPEEVLEKEKVELQAGKSEL